MIDLSKLQWNKTETYQPHPLPSELISSGRIWKGKKDIWYSRCPNCNGSKSHKTMALASDGVFTLCRGCKMERSTNPWLQLKRYYQLKRNEKE